MAVPAGVAEVAGGDVVAHLHHGEHAAHANVPEGALAGHHRQRVPGAAHVAAVGVVLVFGHAVAAHGHVAGQHLPDLLLDAALVHAHGVGDVVTHRPHGVVGHVAVQGPVARHGLELDVAHLADTDDLGDFAPPLRLRPAASITTGDLELHAVQVDGVVPHAQVADA